MFSLQYLLETMNSHHCCYLLRNLTLSLICRVYRRPISFSQRSYSKSIHPNFVSSRCKASIAKQNGVRSTFSSWEKSADRYFSKNGGIKTDHNDFTDSRSRSEKSVVRPKWKESTEQSSVPKMVGQCVYGIGPVMAALTVSRREFYALYIQEGLEFAANNNNKKKKKEKKGLEKILKLAKELGLTIIESTKHDLNMASENRPHQGLILDASPLEIVDIRELEPVEENRDQRSPLWVALDEVTDPQNLGAIIRSAYFFGAEGVVICARNSAPLSGVVCKASAGSLELVELRSCYNMMRFLESSVENGWRVVGGSVSSKAVDLREVEVGMPTVLVLGSEGYGLRPLVERCCSQLIRIDGRMSVDGGEMGFFLAVESLNVSVAAGVLMYHLVGDGKNLLVEKMEGICS